MATNIQTIKTFTQLIKYLRTDLGWPVDEEDADNLTFDYDPEELGLDEKSAVKVRAAKQLRPLIAGQPWGIFWVDFEPKKLPVTVMRRILNQLVAKKRGGKSSQATWNLDDLLFISAVGSEKSDRREITFAHFHQEEGDLPTLRVLGWDGADTVLKIDYVAKTLKEKLTWPQNPKDVDAWRERWAEAFKHKPGHVIKTADALAERLAELARSIRAAAETIMEHESDRGRLRQLHKAFQTALIHDLTEEDFADTYAQTITYGLLTAAISRTDMSGGGGTALVADNITDMVPVTNPFLREMLETFLHAGGRKGGKHRRGGIDFDELGIQDVVELLRSDETDLPAILRDFNNRAEGEDPVIRFYEDFLSAYDKALKVQRGVFYTPKPVVSYIVRGVHELLQTEFGLEDGLADTVTWGEMQERNADVKIPKGVHPNSPFVVILDPATGTATFLVEVIDLMYKTMVAKWKKQGLSEAQIQKAWNEYVPTSLLPRLYGYELMMAPYAIAHMKIGLKLYETGYHFASDQRANIYLTNALEEPSQLAEGAASLFEALGHEAQAVNNVKRKVHFTLVIGNPPYSGHSANASKNEDGSWNFIGKLLQDYYKVDGKPLGEKNPKWLQDDYVKFIRFGQWNVHQSGNGILAMITNHGYLDNPTFRGMRQHLIDSFSRLYLMDLHGNTKKKEVAPDGTKDENVFDITQGVAICLLASSAKSNKEIIHTELFGSREFKYDYLKNQRNHITSSDLNAISPKSPYYLFSPQNFDLDAEYQNFWKITEIMPINSVGVVTARDRLTIQWTPEQVYNTIKLFSSLTVEKARKEYELGADARDWKVSFAQKDILESGKSKSRIIPISYRPFDIRYTYYTGKSRGFICMPRPDVMQHFISHENFAFHLCRQVRIDEWQHILATNQVTDDCYVSNITSERGYTLPLYIYPENEDVRDGQRELFSTQVKERKPNLEQRFISEAENKFNLRFIGNKFGDLHKTFGPEDVFHYMYAVFHSPTYRSHYAEFLKIDFPRLPLTSNVELFRQLCGLGEELVALHLLESSALKKPIPKFKGKGDNVVAKGHPKYEDGTVLINPAQGFDGIPQEVWEFHVGGYQVCHKWLKDRRGRELSPEDIAHYQKVVVALKETIRLMDEIDQVIEVHGGWPMK